MKLMDVSSYLHKLLANDAITKDLLGHFKNIENILSHPACKMIQQLRFDYNLIEVSNGFCFNISQRPFRIQVFNTTSLPVTHLNVDRWIYDNAMHCIACVADQINEHHHLIDPQELWYEEGANNNLISSQMSQTLWARTQIVQITQAYLEAVNAHASTSSTKDL